MGEKRVVVALDGLSDRQALALAERLGKRVGTYKVGLYKGNIEILKRESASSLFSPEIRSIKAKGFSQRMAKDAATIRGLPFEILAKRGQIEG